MVLQAYWAPGWHWKVKVWVIFPLPLWQNSLSSFPCPTIYFHPLSVSAQSSCTCIMNLPGKLSNGISALPSIIISSNKLWPWFFCCCTHQNDSTGGHRREGGGSGARSLGSSVCYHGYKKIHGSRSFIVTGWELSFRHALKQVAQDCSQIFKTWLDTVLDNLV